MPRLDPPYAPATSANGHLEVLENLVTELSTGKITQIDPTTLKSIEESWISDRLRELFLILGYTHLILIDDIDPSTEKDISICGQYLLQYQTSFSESESESEYIHIQEEIQNSLYPLQDLLYPLQDLRKQKNITSIKEELKIKLKKTINKVSKDQATFQTHIDNFTKLQSEPSTDSSLILEKIDPIIQDWKTIVDRHNQLNALYPTALTILAHDHFLQLQELQEKFSSEEKEISAEDLTTLNNIYQSWIRERLQELLLLERTQYLLQHAASPALDVHITAWSNCLSSQTKEVIPTIEAIRYETQRITKPLISFPIFIKYKDPTLPLSIEKLQELQNQLTSIIKSALSDIEKKDPTQDFLPDNTNFQKVRTLVTDWTKLSERRDHLESLHSNMEALIPNQQIASKEIETPQNSEDQRPVTPTTPLSLPTTTPEKNSNTVILPSTPPCTTRTSRGSSLSKTPSARRRASQFGIHPTREAELLEIINQLKKELNESQIEIETLRGKPIKGYNQNTINHEEVIEEGRERIAYLEATNQELTDKIIKIEKRLRESSTEIHNFVKIDQNKDNNITRLETEVTQYKAEVQRLKASIDNLNNSLESSREAFKECSIHNLQLQQQMDESRSILKTQIPETDEQPNLSAAIQMFSKKYREALTTINRYQEIENLIKELQQNLENNPNIEDQFLHALSQKKEMEKTLQEALKENQVLADVLKKTREDREKTKTELEELKAQTRAELASAKSHQITGNNASLEQLQGNMQGLGSTVIQKQEVLSDAQQRIETLEKNLTAQLTALEAAAMETNNTIQAQYKKGLHALQQRIAKKDEENNQLAEELHSLEIQLSHQTPTNNLEQSNQHVHTEKCFIILLTTFLETTKQLKEEINKLQAERKQLGIQLTEFKEQCEKEIHQCIQESIQTETASDQALQAPLNKLFNDTAQTITNEGINNMYTLTNQELITERATNDIESLYKKSSELRRTINQLKKDKLALEKQRIQALINNEHNDDIINQITSIEATIQTLEKEFKEVDEEINEFDNNSPNQEDSAPASPSQSIFSSLHERTNTQTTGFTDITNISSLDSDNNTPSKPTGSRIPSPEEYKNHKKAYQAWQRTQAELLKAQEYIEELKAQIKKISEALEEKEKANLDVRNKLNALEKNLDTISAERTNEQTVQIRELQQELIEAQQTEYLLQTRVSILEQALQAKSEPIAGQQTQETLEQLKNRVIELEQRQINNPPQPAIKEASELNTHQNIFTTLGKLQAQVDALKSEKNISPEIQNNPQLQAIQEKLANVERKLESNFTTRQETSKQTLQADKQNTQQLQEHIERLSQQLSAHTSSAPSANTHSEIINPDNNKMPSISPGELLLNARFTLPTTKNISTQEPNSIIINNSSLVDNLSEDAFLLLEKLVIWIQENTRHLTTKLASHGYESLAKRFLALLESQDGNLSSTAAACEEKLIHLEKKLSNLLNDNDRKTPSIATDFLPKQNLEKKQRKKTTSTQNKKLEPAYQIYDLFKENKSNLNLDSHQLKIENDQDKLNLTFHLFMKNTSQKTSTGFFPSSKKEGKSTSIQENHESALLKLLPIIIEQAEYHPGATITIDPSPLAQEFLGFLSAYIQLYKSLFGEDSLNLNIEKHSLEEPSDEEIKEKLKIILGDEGTRLFYPDAKLHHTMMLTSSPHAI